jgi:hypothetical protein
MDRWLNCTLDENGVQLLQTWREELQAVEERCLALEATLGQQLTAITATEKTKATCTFGTEEDLNRLILTAVEGGSAIHSLSIYLANPGPTANYNPLTPSTYNPTIIDYRSQGIELIYVKLGTDTLGNVVTGPRALAQAFSNQGYDTLFTSAYPDLFYWWTFVFDFPLPSNVHQSFSGGNDASLTFAIAALNAAYQGTGKDYETMLEQALIPVAKEGATTAETLSQISNVVVLSSGKRLLRSGTNLLVLRELWALLGANRSAVDLLVVLLGYAEGTPHVVWIQEISQTVELPACDGGGTQTTVVNVVDVVNGKPSSKMCSPTVWWLQAIMPSVDFLSRLTSFGLSDVQVQDALDASKETTHIISDPSLMTTLGLSSEDLLELLELSEVEGVSAELLVEETLTELSKSEVTEGNGFVSANFNMPDDDLRAALSPETSMASDILAFNESPCIDPYGKGILNALIAADSYMTDTVLRIVKRLKDRVKSQLNKISAVLANLQGVLSKLDVMTCLIGGKVTLDGPTFELLRLQIKPILVSVQQIIGEISAPICQVVDSLQALLGPIAGSIDCLKPGLSNDLFNAWGSQFMQLVPCIQNPFDVMGMLGDLLGKVQSIQGMTLSLMGDAQSITLQLNVISSFTSQAPADVAMESCHSPTLGAMVSSIKSKFV